LPRASFTLQLPAFQKHEEERMGVRIALVVLNVFAALWAWAGLRFSGFAPGLSLLPIVVSLALLAWGWRGVGTVPSRGRHVGRVIAVWSTIEGLALFVTANVLENLDRGDLMLPFGAIIVGLHFFPLARGIPVRLYHATGAGLLLTGIAGLLAPAAERPLLVGLGAALVLWATALVIIVRAPRASLAAA
jgi:hypothetical protein